MGRSPTALPIGAVAFAPCLSNTWASTAGFSSIRSPADGRVGCRGRGVALVRGLDSMLFVGVCRVAPAARWSAWRRGFFFVAILLHLNILLVQVRDRDANDSIARSGGDRLPAARGASWTGVNRSRLTSGRRIARRRTGAARSPVPGDPKARIVVLGLALRHMDPLGLFMGDRTGDWSSFRAMYFAELANDDRCRATTGCAWSPRPSVRHPPTNRSRANVTPVPRSSSASWHFLAGRSRRARVGLGYDADSSTSPLLRAKFGHGVSVPLEGGPMLLLVPPQSTEYFTGPSDRANARREFSARSSRATGDPSCLKRLPALLGSKSPERRCG